MKSNGLLKWLLIPLVLLVVFVAMRLFSTPPNRTTVRPELDVASELTTEEMKSLGIEADTPRDTVATLVAQVKELRSELETALEENKQQKAENQRLRQREGAIDQRIQSALDAERDRSRQDREQLARDQEELRGLVVEVQQRLEGQRNAAGHADLPVGLGLRDNEAEALSDPKQMHWSEPQDARPDDKRTRSREAPTVGTSAYPTSFRPATADSYESIETNSDVPRHESDEADSFRRVYTVPADATLIGSVAMTALVGRVPVDGVVNDPYSFKVLIGPDNLTANGIELPDLAGAVASGTASGDWTLSCVRGHIHSLTVVFHDGTTRTISSDAARQSSSTGATQDRLAWISDPHGIPCVSGERHSNAQQYLATQSLITAAGAGAAALIDSDSSSVSVSGSGTLGTVGISGNEAMDRILANGVQEMSKWVEKLYGQAFAAVYVKPGAKVALHIERPLAIDYDPAGRKVHHTLGGKNHVSSLD